MTKVPDRATREAADPMDGVAAEGAVFNAEVAAAIQDKLAKTNYGNLLSERGVTTVALDENGDIVEHRPDGSSTVVNK